MSTRRRLEPLDPARWTERQREILGGTLEPVARMEGDPDGGADGEEGRGASDGGGALNILRTIAHHPRLLEPFLGFAATLALGGELPRRASELLALRAAWNCRSAFEWGHHVVYGRQVGLSEAEIGRIAAAPDHPDWAEEDRLLLRAADELHAGQDLSDATWSRLREHWSDAQLLEIPFVVGHYSMLSMVANATGVPLEDGLPSLPEAR